MPDNFYVVTGGPGSGKSSLIEALAAKGVKCMPESGRAVIRSQRLSTGGDLRQTSPTAFAEMMLRQDLQSYRQAQQWDGTVMFDRGLPDVIGYLLLCRLPVPDHLDRAVRSCRYNRKAFIAPHWSEIYRQDAERLQSAEEASETCDMMRHVYTELGYELAPLPLASLDERVAFIQAETE